MLARARPRARGRLPTTPIVGFQLIAFTCIWLTAVATYFLALRSGFSPVLALAGMVMFLALGYATKFSLYDFWLTDPAAFLFVAVAILLLLRGNDVPSRSSWPSGSWRKRA